ncbi:coiled-coil domain-containing protein 55-domain containing protein [Geopyxis carbonaria]|nr:coiled-coil domain-containing protein 55-domain containing protein [Geopyxis carbonaria]
MQSVTRAKRTADAADAAERKPKYMENLLVAAEVRKRDALRAKEKLLAKEREEEGEEFKDKEAFVTEAYKAQQEALLKAEKEELEREEALRKKSAGMSSFHRNMLEKMEGKHDAVVAAAEAPVAAGGVVAEGAEGEDVEGEVEKKARELREKGAAIEVNEEGQVVDKTQLLSGGLNVAPAKSKARIAVEVDPRRARAPGAYGRGRASEDSRARQTRMVEQQLEAVKKREREAEEEAKEEIVRQSKSRKTETDVMSAKERYLQRKAAAAAAAKEKEGGKGEEGK